MNEEGKRLSRMTAEVVGDMASKGKIFGPKDARAFFEAGAAFAREHQFMPYEMNAVKAAEEAVARWPE